MSISPLVELSVFGICSDYLFKLLLIGDSGVGKSCLLLRFSVSFFSLFSEIKHCSFLHLLLIRTHVGCSAAG